MEMNNNTQSRVPLIRNVWKIYLDVIPDILS